jgi:hypothetical protein
MSLESESNTVESLKVAARNIAVLADVVGEQVRPAVKLAVDTVDEIATAMGTTRIDGKVSPIAEAAAARESLDGAARDLGALVDAVGDQVRPAIKFAVEAVDAIEAARVRIWKSLVDLGSQTATGAA